MNIENQRGSQEHSRKPVLPGLSRIDTEDLHEVPISARHFLDAIPKYIEPECIPERVFPYDKYTYVALTDNRWYFVSVPLPDERTGQVTGYVMLKDESGAVVFEDVDLLAISAQLLESAEEPRSDGRSVAELRAFEATTAEGRERELNALAGDSLILTFRGQLPFAWTGYRQHPLMPGHLRDRNQPWRHAYDSPDLVDMAPYYLATNINDGKGVNFADIPDVRQRCLEAASEAGRILTLEFQSLINIDTEDGAAQCVQVTGPENLAAQKMPTGLFSTAFMTDTGSYCAELQRHGYTYRIDQNLVPEPAGQEFYVLGRRGLMHGVVKPERPAGIDPLAPLRELDSPQLNALLDGAPTLAPGYWEEKMLSRAGLHDAIQMESRVPLRHYYQELANTFPNEMFWLEDWNGGVLSNFFENHPLQIDESNRPAGTRLGEPPLSYPTLEHAYQAAKFADPETCQLIAAAESAIEAKTIARERARADPDSVLSDWNEIKGLVMLRLLQIKFSDPELRDLLLSTGDCGIIEGTLRTDAKGNPWNDDVWGLDADAHGWNMLGRLLMIVRAQLRGEIPMF